MAGHLPGREARISLNTLQRIERGEWVAAHNLLMVCSVLDLEVGLVDRAHDPARDASRSRVAAADGRLGRPAADDRIATYDEDLALLTRRTSSTLRDGSWRGVRAESSVVLDADAVMTERGDLAASPAGSSETRASRWMATS